MPAIETELKCLLTDNEYERLRSFFDANARLEKEDDQTTYYFNGPVDLRIQKNTSGAKIVVKGGRVHDLHRDEIEVQVDGSQFDNLEKLFIAAGYEIEIKWFRHRLQYIWNDITVCLDNTRGYGRILELEKMSTIETQAADLKELEQAAGQLGIAITSNEEFNAKFAYYKANWPVILEKIQA